MPVFVLTDAKVVINSVNLSDHITKATVKAEADDIETTAFGTTGYRSRIGGLKGWSINLDFNQDTAAANVDATLFPLLGTVTPVTAKSTSGANSATNPEYQGSVLVTEYIPIDGSVGDLSKVSVSWPGTGALTRAVA